MSGTVRGEIWLLGGSVCTGIALMMMYDGLRIFRWLVRHGSFWTGMEESQKTGKKRTTRGQAENMERK